MSGTWCLERRRDVPVKSKTMAVHMMNNNSNSEKNNNNSSVKNNNNSSSNKNDSSSQKKNNNLVPQASAQGRSTAHPRLVPVDSLLPPKKSHLKGSKTTMWWRHLYCSVPIPMKEVESL